MREKDQKLCLACVALLKQNPEDFTVHDIAACMRDLTGTGNLAHIPMIPRKPPTKDCKSDCVILNLNNIIYDNEFLQKNPLSSLVELYQTSGIDGVNQILGDILPNIQQ